MLRAKQLPEALQAVVNSHEGVIRAASWPSDVTGAALMPVKG